MAILPTYQDLGERPVPTGSQNVATYEPPNWRQIGVAGENLSGAGREMENVAQIVQQTNQKQDQVSAMSAFNTLQAKRLALESDPEKGFANVKGNAVVGPKFIQDYSGQFDDAQAQVAAGLDNENQKQIFAQHAEVAALQFRGNLMQHQAKQTLAFNAQTRADTINNGMSDISAHPNDDQTFDTQNLLMQQAIVGAGKDIGLSGDALAAYVKDRGSALTSQALAYRTKGLLMKSPIDAADFFNKHEMDFDPNDRDTLGKQIKTTVDAQTSRISGQKAYSDALVTAAPSPQPQDFHADFVKPYSQPRIDQIVQQIKAPSQYDPLISKYATQYNVSPAELKLRMVVESGGDPNAVAKDRGGNVLASGLMQFSPGTAKQYGINPADPEQSIQTAAKLMASAGGTTGGDMSKVDKTYYAGSGSMGGPNTTQYVENLRAVRQSLFGSPSAQPTVANIEGAEGRVIENAKATAQAQRPDDAVFADKVVAEAHKSWAQSLQVARSTEYQNFQGTLDAAMKSGAMSLSDLPPAAQQSFAQLTTPNQVSVEAQFDRNVRAARGEFTRSDPALVNNLRQRIYLPDGNPLKISQPGDLSTYVGQGLNYTDHEHLIKEMGDANNPEGNPFMKQVAGVKSSATKMLVGQVSNIGREDFAQEAAYRFGIDLDNKIKAVRAAGKDPQTLLDPTSKDYVMSPGRVAAFMPSEAQMVSQLAQRKAGAATPATAATPAAPPKPVAPRLPGESISDYLARTAPS